MKGYILYDHLTPFTSQIKVLLEAKMEYDLVFFSTAFAVGILILSSVLRRANGWFYSLKFSSKEYNIPPGDMGWPLIGNTIFFFQSFKLGGDLSKFINYFVDNFGSGGMYRTFMFGKPSIIVTAPETCRKILMDDDNFDLGFPLYLKNLLGQEPVNGPTTVHEERLLRRLTNPIKTQGSLCYYFHCIDKNVKDALEKSAAKQEPSLFITEMKRPTFDVLMQVLLNRDMVSKELLDLVFKENTARFRGLHYMPINLPGFGYNKAIKARNKIVKAYQQIINERKIMLANDKDRSKYTSILDAMIDSITDDEKGLRDGNVLKALLWFTFGGYESVARVATQTVMNLIKHPEFYEKAKEEQEEIVKRRPSNNAGLSYEEIGQMKYLSMVINETLRMGSTETVLFRDSNTPVTIGGYTIPKGWKFLTILGNFHMDPKTFLKPKEFDPSRWEAFETKPASFLPFGTGPKMCPGANLAKLEVSVFLHYILLYYRIEPLNAKKIAQAAPENFTVRFKKL